jgi:hypothetical protein
MKYEGDPKKNELLKSDRNISFEKIVIPLARSDV